VSRLHNLEWIFEKDDPEVPQKIVNLVDAVQRLPRSWPDNPDDARKYLGRLLKLNDGLAFCDRAWEEVLDCHPPIHELSEATHSLAVLRWLAHRILPYPTFLVDRFYTAARLRVSPATVSRLLEENGDIAEQLGGCLYGGILDSLMGPRWWRAGIDALVWEWTDGSLDTERVVTSIGERSAVELEPAPDEPVVIVGLNYQPQEILPVQDAVRIRLDDWPPFADDAWTSVRHCYEDDHIASLLWPEDRRRLKL
jgi:hypothetical protein